MKIMRTKNKTTTSKHFECNTKLIGSTPNNGNRLDEEVVILLKYVSNFWRSFNLLLINCEIEPDYHGEDIVWCLKYKENLEQLVIHLTHKWKQQQLVQNFK